MKQELDSTRELIITSIVISPDGYVEISYAEKRKQGDHAGIAEQIIVDVKGAKAMDQFDELVELAREIVDLGHESIRAPVDTIDPRQRMRKKRELARPDDDDDDD